MAPIRRFMLLLAVLAALLVVTGCGKDKQNVSVAEHQNTDTGASPTALAGLPPGVETQNLTIEQSKFDTDELRLQQNQATTLSITNKDATAYTLAADGLIASTALPPGQTTPISLTTTNAGTFEARLAAADATDTLDTFRIIVEQPGGTSP